MSTLSISALAQLKTYIIYTQRVELLELWFAAGCVCPADKALCVEKYLHNVTCIIAALLPVIS